MTTTKFMAKKIYDIKPPKISKKSEKEIKEFLVDAKPKKVRTVEQPKRERKPDNKKKSAWGPIAISMLAVVLLIGVYLFFALPKAEITIWPKVDTLSFQQTITADKSANGIDVTKEVIPAQYFEASKTDSQDFPATGNADNTGMATGTITIYNKFDPPTSMSFKAGTHFMSDSGKLFVSLQKIVIPAAKKVGGKITAGAVSVKVQAVNGGTDYNIAPANFSIPGLKGTSYYYSIYGVSTVAMAGGYTGKIKKVTDDDIQGAEDVLTKKATDDATATLKNQVSSDYILLDNAILSNTTNTTAKVKSGTVADTFNASATVKVSGLAFKKSDLDSFAKSYITSQSAQGKSLLDGSYKISYSATSADVSGGKLILSLNFSSGAYQNIDTNSLALSLVGKNTSQINQTIQSQEGSAVTKIKINFWPFWVTSAPNNQSKVKVELKFQ